ncbi:hypothetical protein [Variovorax sp. OV329]|uniref:hypothetical protein n=1 Tax=Variovorax sp. OV329 TaxID=1882825 RepID=UPI0011134567|nr:hypothetical protein [Variovorax sp. OV329]
MSQLEDDEYRRRAREICTAENHPEHAVEALRMQLIHHDFFMEHQPLNRQISSILAKAVPQYERQADGTFAMQVTESSRSTRSRWTSCAGRSINWSRSTPRSPSPDPGSHQKG